MGQARVHAPRPVGFADHFADSQTQRLWQALAAVLDVVSQARPAAFDELLVGFLEAGRGFHARLAPGTAFQVTYTVQRSQNLFTKLGAFFEDGANHVWGGVLASRQALIMRFVTEQLVTHEANITQGGFVLRHSDEPLLMNPG
ncbi:hypothetical protein D3C72_1152480 [compost metagenome]